jgi:hypothetical protein
LCQIFFRVLAYFISRFIHLPLVKPDYKYEIMGYEIGTHVELSQSVVVALNNLKHDKPEVFKHNKPSVIEIIREIINIHSEFAQKSQRISSSNNQNIYGGWWRTRT